MAGLNLGLPTRDTEATKTQALRVAALITNYIFKGGAGMSDSKDSCSGSVDNADGRLSCESLIRPSASPLNVT